MANTTLFVTSLLLGYLHLHAIYALSPQKRVALGHIPTVYAIGVLTSVVNHGCTHPFPKWLDRIWMYLGVCMDLTYGCMLSFDASWRFVAQPHVFLVALYIMCYLLAKKYAMARLSFSICKHSFVCSLGTMSHVLTHGIATGLHLIILA